MRRVLSIPALLCCLLAAAGCNDSDSSSPVENTASGGGGSAENPDDSTLPGKKGDEDGGSSSPVDAPRPDESWRNPDASAGLGGAGPVSNKRMEFSDEQEAELRDSLSEVEDLDADGLLEVSNLDFEEISYDPLTSSGLDLIQDSALSMTSAEEERFKENGFVISSRQVFPHFSYGYKSIYSSDLPLYISADSILHAVHRSYEDLLSAFEEWSLVPALEAYLFGMREALSEAQLDKQSHRDLDIFLTVPLGLLRGEDVKPLDPDNAEAATGLFKASLAAGSASVVELFGTDRQVDFSQFKPRGHYTKKESLEQYFRAMIWLGRIDFRFVESTPKGELILRRNQVRAALALLRVSTKEWSTVHGDIDSVITAFVGEHDGLTMSVLPHLWDDLDLEQLSDLDDLSDKKIMEVIFDGDYGKQRISSHLIMEGLDGEPVPLPPSFALFGQRYVIDSHVFSNVVFDRVKAKRMMPDPLDVAYAALGNDQAAQLLEPELRNFDYASALASMRVVADFEPKEFWEFSLYNRWLGSLRALSPSADNSDSHPAFQLGRSEAWGRRLLNTQLASWAELRHDTVLYSKQSYTSEAGCEFPDAYVDPYPEVFSRIEDYARHAQLLLGSFAFAPPKHAQAHLVALEEVAGILKEMAEHQLTGSPHTEEHMAFVNDIVYMQGLCGKDVVLGWYGRLFYHVDSAAEWAPTIADVHTQPTDASGNEVGRVLHVGTGNARLMTVSVETCSGPRAYVGLASSYYEYITENFERLADEDWEEMLTEGEPPSPVWMQDLIAQ